VSLEPPIDPTSAQWRAEKARDESERRYRHLVEHSLGLICTHDLDGLILSVNPAAARSLGYEAHEGAGRNLRDFLVPDTRHLFDGYLHKIRQHGTASGLMRVVARDGTERVWMYHNIRYQEPGSEPYVLGHALDITDRVRAERALRDSEHALKRAYAELDQRVRERTTQLEHANERLRAEIVERERAEAMRERALIHAQDANRLKEEFLATLSHELRTPLNAILGWAQILSTRALEPATLRGLEVIERNARVQTRLIEDILDVSRIVTGKLILKLETIDLAVVIGAALDAVRPTAQAKGVRLAEEIEPEVYLVQGDAQRLQQVIWNLLANAIKFTPAGGMVTTTLSRVRNSIEVTVHDTGVGIRDEVLPFVFDRFRQADSSTTRSHGGLGLGLAIVRHVLELHGGTVAARSAGEGKGSTFRIELPAHTAPAVDIPVIDRDLPVVAGERLLEGRRVLVVDDHDDARQLIAAIVGSSGASVRTAGSSREAFEMLLQSAPDVLIADIGMPEEDGCALVRRIRALDRDRGGSIPAIALTAYARAEDRERALTAGFQRHVTKPVEPRTLISIVAELLRG
jgi:PAS domain S-box-containing protein